MFKTRLRLQKQPNAAMPTRGNEYGNYERFEKNSITEESDQGSTDRGKDTFMRNYNDMLRQLSTEEASRLKKRENDAVEKSITDPAVLN